ncbi:hypothetical protein Y1Q_0008872 [Alligator mississippiensis]|uniref:Secreted protein n=1 Tax=Alligator mississippiensis TaxID=8496 RepID=A0A151NAI3_ALLMI|nr:hypothetical protein Y1Q_0008872 [Alligator mississippiensis]
MQIQHPYLQHVALFPGLVLAISQPCLDSYIAWSCQTPVFAADFHCPWRLYSGSAHRGFTFTTFGFWCSIQPPLLLVWYSMT